MTITNISAVLDLPVNNEQRALPANPRSEPPLANDPPQRRFLGQNMPGSINNALRWMKAPRNVKWESRTGPLQRNTELSFRVLDLVQDKVANGSSGYISKLKTENGQMVVGKVSLGTMFDNMGNKVDDLALEFAAFEKIHKKAGPHRNLVKAYGIATVRDENDVPTRMLILGHIDGTTGDKFFADLRQSWKDGKITSEEYWGVVQFIFRRLLDVTEHLGKAEVVDNDIHPENFMIDANTCEPVLIDLGLWSNHGARNVEGSFPFRSDDDCSTGGVDERSDVFMVVASLVAVIEGFELVKGEDGESEPNFHPKRGLNVAGEAGLNAQGQAEHVPCHYSVGTAYTNFVEDGLEEDKEKRLPAPATLTGLEDPEFPAKVLDFLRIPAPHSQKMLDFLSGRAARIKLKNGYLLTSPSARAQAHPFLNDSMLDEDAEKAMEKIRATIQKVIATRAEKGAKGAEEGAEEDDECETKSELEKSIVKEMGLNEKAFGLNPTLAGLARLSTIARTNSALRENLDKTVPDKWRELVSDAERVVPVLNLKSERFDALSRLVGTMPAQDATRKSGVDADGVRKLEPVVDGTNVRGAKGIVHAVGVRKKLEVSAAEEKLRSTARQIMSAVSPDDLRSIRTYAEDAQAFLHQISMIKGIPESERSRLTAITEQVRDKADFARRILEIEGVNLAALEAEAETTWRDAKEAPGFDKAPRKVTVAMNVKEKASALAPKFDTDEFKRERAYRSELAGKEEPANHWRRIDVEK